MVRRPKTRIPSLLAFLVPAALLLGGCQLIEEAGVIIPKITLQPQVTLPIPDLTNPAPRTAILPPAGTEPATAGWYSVYFTDPSGPGRRTYRGGPDAALAEAIARARIKIDIAVLQFDLFSLRDALIAAYRRGVTVRMVVDSDYIDDPVVQEMVRAGIHVLGDRREGLMHNKFAVIDGLEVWTGSMNYTVSDTYRNNNNLVRIRSQRMAQDYTAEFEEMFADDRFGAGSPANTPYPEFTVDSTRMEVYFSPDDGVAAHLVDLLNGARKSIHFLAYSFTRDDLGSAIIERARAGVGVAGVMDASQSRSNEGTEFDRFQASGLDVRRDGNPDNMHDKVLIIDGEVVVTGSYNFSNNAERTNDENVVVIHNAEIGALYEQEFQRIFAAGQ